MITQSIKNKISELKKTYPKLTAVSFGKKITDNKYTGELSFNFYVKKKLDVSELDYNEILPYKIFVDGVSYSTDVIEMVETSLICNPTILGQCYSFKQGNVGSCSTMSSPNQNVVRPVQGGLEIKELNAGGRGTMGFIAVDVVSNCLVGVTNNHVVIPNYIITSQRNTTNNITNEAGVIVGQNSTSNPIGRIVRYVPTYYSPTPNYVDGAIFAMCANTVDTSVSWKQYNLPIDSPMPFATTQEIDNLLITNPPVSSTGRSTGAKFGNCGLTISSLSVSLSIGTSPFSPMFPGTLYYEDCIEYTRPDPQCTYPCANGDSGSALVAELGGVWKIIGLVFAAGSACSNVTMPCCAGGISCPPSGPCFPAFTKAYACRIDRVAEELGIYAWDGSQKPFATNIETVTFPGSYSSPTLICNNKEYWQVGLTTSNNPCT
jgi:hypothetical protein